MAYFKNPRSLEELRKQYKELLKRFHPDNPGGSTAACQEINSEYSRLFEHLKNRRESGNGAEKANFDINLDRALREMLLKVVNLDGLQIEICGSWIWLSGNTYPRKSTLKALGFSWASNKKMWCWHDVEYVKRTHKAVSMDFIREKYGSMEVETKAQARLA